MRYKNSCGTPPSHINISNILLTFATVCLEPSHSPGARSPHSSSSCLFFVSHLIAGDNCATYSSGMYRQVVYYYYFI